MARYYTYYAVSNKNTPDSQGDWRYYYDITTSQNQSANTSTITIKHYLQCNNIAITNGVTSYTKVNSETKNVSKSGTLSSGTHTVGTTTHTVSHNNDGTGSFSFQAHGTGGGYSKYTSSVTIDLPKISRASSVTDNSSPSNYIDFGSNVTFTITRPSDETHTLTYKVGSTTYTIGTGIATSKTYAFPVSLISSFPNSAYNSIVVTCTSSNGTTDSTTVYLKVPDSYVPTCSLAISDVGSVPSGWGIWVQNKSKIRATITASGVSGSTISSYSTPANGATYTSSSFTTEVLKSSGSQTITSKVTDSRSRTNSASQTISVYAYADPTYVKTQVVRCNANGEEDNDGTYGKVICQYSISACNNKNTKSLKVSYGGVSKTFTLSSYSGTITATTDQLFSGLSISANHSFTFALTDSFSTINQTFVMPPSYVTVSYYHGGKGVTFGQVATEEGFNCYMNADFKAELKQNGINIKDSIPVTTADTNLNAYTDGGIYYFTSAVKPTNIPAGVDGWLVVLNRGSSSSGLKQLWFRHGTINSNDSETYVRTRNNSGTWSSWSKYAMQTANKILWSSSGSYLNGSQTLTLSENVSAQKNGIVLRWQGYVPGEGTKNYNYCYTFIPKQHTLTNNGTGIFCMMAGSNFDVVCSKYVYVYDDKIVGNDHNTDSGTANGITYKNNNFVLTAIIGV